jgi:hypothetical protein
MGKGSKRRRRELGAERLAELLRLGTERGVEVRVFTPIHCRIFGETIVDYWPTTGRTWITGTSDSAREMTPREAIDLATFAQPELMPEGAEDHLRSLQ